MQDESNQQPPADMRSLETGSGPQRLVLRYEDGQEAQALGHIREMAEVDGGNLKWFDAVLLSHQMGRQMKSKIDRLRAGRV